MDLLRPIVPSHPSLSVGWSILNLRYAPLLIHYSPVSIHNWRRRYRRGGNVQKGGCFVRTNISGRCVRRSMMVRIRRRRIRLLWVILLHRLILYMIHGDRLRSLLRDSLLHNLVRCWRRHLSIHLVLKVVYRSRRTPCIHVGVAGHPRTLGDTLIVKIGGVEDLSRPSGRGLMPGNRGLSLLRRYLLLLVLVLLLLLRGWHWLCCYLGELGAVVVVCLNWPRDDRRITSGRKSGCV